MSILRTVLEALGWTRRETPRVMAWVSQDGGPFEWRCLNEVFPSTEAGAVRVWGAQVTQADALTEAWAAGWLTAPPGYTLQVNGNPVGPKVLVREGDAVVLVRNLTEDR